MTNYCNFKRPNRWSLYVWQSGKEKDKTNHLIRQLSQPTWRIVECAGAGAVMERAEPDDEWSLPVLTGSRNQYHYLSLFNSAQSRVAALLWGERLIRDRTGMPSELKPKRDLRFVVASLFVSLSLRSVSDAIFAGIFLQRKWPFLFNFVFMIDWRPIPESRRSQLLNNFWISNFYPRKKIITIVIYYRFNNITGNKLLVFFKTQPYVLTFVPFHYPFSY